MKRITLKRAINLQPVNGRIIICCTDSNGDIKLDGGVENPNILCKKCCEIKPGEERTFNIESNDSALYAVLETDDERKILGKCEAENLSERMILSNKCKDKLSDSPEIEFLERKKRGGAFSRLGGNIKALIAVFSIIIIIGGFIGGSFISKYYSERSRKPERFDLGEISITLGKSYRRDTREKNFYAYFYTVESGVIITTETFEDFPEFAELSVREYLEGIKRINGDSTSVIVEEDGLTYFVYESQDNLGEWHRWYLYGYKTDDSFWIVQFGSSVKKAKYWEKCYHDWAKSVEFK